MDLFVRVSNKIAINMYTQLGYIVYRTVLEYYSGDTEEDAYGTQVLSNLPIGNLITFRLLCRYAKSLFEGYQQAIDDSVNTSSPL